MLTVAHRWHDMNWTRVRKHAKRHPNCQRNVNALYVTIARRHTHSHRTAIFSPQIGLNYVLCLASVIHLSSKWAYGFPNTQIKWKDKKKSNWIFPFCLVPIVWLFNSIVSLQCSERKENYFFYKVVSVRWWAIFDVVCIKYRIISYMLIIIIIYEWIRWTQYAMKSYETYIDDKDSNTNNAMSRRNAALKSHYISRKK